MGNGYDGRFNFLVDELAYALFDMDLTNTGDSTPSTFATINVGTNGWGDSAHRKRWIHRYLRTRRGNHKVVVYRAPALCLVKINVDF